MLNPSNDTIHLSLQIRFENLTFDIDLNIPCAGITALFGRSGSGKTTLLRCIAGLDRFDSAHIRFGNQIWQSAQQFVAPHQRDVGFVFQESSLLQHLNVIANLEFARRRASAGVSQLEFEQIVELLGIHSLLHKPVEQLSGGERQRVAIARTLMLKPALLLLDEPLASLDQYRKQRILGFLENLTHDWQMPIIYVSHSADEVTRLADYLVVLEEGKVKLHGDIRQVMASSDQPWQSSEEPFSLLIGVVKQAIDQHGLTQVAVGDETFLMPRQAVSDGQPIRLHLYAKDISLTLQRPQQSSILNICSCVIETISEATEDGQCIIRLQLASTSVLARISYFSCQQLALQKGQSLFAQIKAVSIVQ